MLLTPLVEGLNLTVLIYVKIFAVFYNLYIIFTPVIACYNRFLMSSYAGVSGNYMTVIAGNLTHPSNFQSSSGVDGN